MEKWIFKEIRDQLEEKREEEKKDELLSAGEKCSMFNVQCSMNNHWKMDILRQQVQTSIDRLDERRGILHVRRHLAASPLFKGIPDFRQTRIRMLRAETAAELYAIMDEIEKNYLS